MPLPLHLIDDPSGSPGLRQRWRAVLQRVAHDPTLGISAALFITLTYLVVGPLLSIGLDMITVHLRDQMTIDGETGDLTTYYLHRALLSEDAARLVWNPLRRTAVVAFAIAVLSLSIGLLVAWLVVRTNMPGRRWLGNVMVLPYILPSWTLALAWLTVFKNRRLAGPSGFMESLGFTPPDWLAYGAIPIIVTMSLHYFPFAFLMFGNAMRSMDSQLEESGQMLGASRRTIFRRIVVPLLLPAVMSAVLLTISRVLGTFGTPYVLGRPVRYDVLSTSLYRNYLTGSPGTAAVIAAVIVLLGVAVVAIDLYVLREHRKFVTIGVKGGMKRLIDLKRWRWPAHGLVFGLLAISSIVPLIILLLSTIMISPGSFSLENFTLRFWTAESIPQNPGQSGLLVNPDILRVAWNSLRVVVVASTLCGLVGFIVGYVVVRTGGVIGGAMRQLSFLPYLIPSIGFAAALLSLFAVRRGPMPALYGTISLLIIAMAVSYLPMASRVGISAMMQVGKEPEEAAMMVGARWRRRFRTIVLPIQKGALVTAVLLPFVSGMKELSLVIMLASPQTELLTTQALRYTDNNYTQLANGLMIIIVAIIAITTFVVQRATKTNLASGLQS
jgi:iron(III) transport system permease protein